MTAGCEGKQGFHTYTEGFKAAKRIRKYSGAGERGPIVLYRCSYCAFWHLGSRPKGRR